LEINDLAVPALDLRGLLSRLATAECEFVVIGSSALRVQGWEVAPADLDLFVPDEEIANLRDVLGIGDGQGEWVEDGEARRFECEADRGPVDIYTAVSGHLRYADVRAESISVRLGIDDLSVQVGSLEHVRDMRAAVGREELPQSAVRPAEKRGVPQVIAIDGPAGAGKSTVTRAVADRLGFTYLDTGAMYRSVTLAVLEGRVDTDDAATIARIADGARIGFRQGGVFLDGRDVTAAIRSVEVTRATPHIAAYPEVRAAMVEHQRQLFTEGSYVAEGRDTGTVVAPDAPLKVYLTASPEERARRRSLEIGEPVEAVLADMKERDRLDSARKVSALKIAEDAVLLDTTGRPVDAIVDDIVDLARERGIV
jgi:CMP/dCMP kinase